MSYTAAQYADQQRVMELARRANAGGLCPVCRSRPQSIWPDGVQRITCGADVCYERWLNIRPPAHNSPAHQPATATPEIGAVDIVFDNKELHHD
jgi:hypothetical protein